LVAKGEPHVQTRRVFFEFSGFEFPRGNFVLLPGSRNLHATPTVRQRQGRTA